METRKIIPEVSLILITNGRFWMSSSAQAGLFDEVVVAVASNDVKSPLFTAYGGDGVALLKPDGGEDLATVTVASFSGIADGVCVGEAGRAPWCADCMGGVGLLNLEFQMALINRKLQPKIETVFLTPQEEYTYLSFRIVKEIA